jgi:hypothetical protein
MLLQVAQIYKQKINYQLLEKDLSCPDFMYYPSIYLENTWNISLTIDSIQPEFWTSDISHKKQDSELLDVIEQANYRVQWWAHFKLAIHLMRIG